MSAVSRYGLRPIGDRARIVLLAATGLAAIIGCGSSDPPAPPLLEIAVVDVVQRDQPIVLEMVGTTLGSADIPVRARIEGVITGIHFREGRAVEKDQLLYEIDPVPFQTKVVEAEGDLAGARTALAKYKADLNRIRPLAEMNAVSQADLDGAQAMYEASIAEVSAAKARVKQAEIELDYTKIRSPIAGLVGITAAKEGEFVGRDPNPVVLNYVSLVDPIRVRFAIDERRYLMLARNLRDMESRGEKSTAGEGLVLVLSDGTTHPHPGTVIAADASIDSETGTFTFEADWPNPESLVLAGQFARVRAVVETLEDALLVPSRAISELQGSFRIFVVEDDGSVEMRVVELGAEVDSLRILQSGVKSGERVAVEIMKLQPGMTIKPKLVAMDEGGRIVAPAGDAAESSADPEGVAETEGAD